MRVGHAAGQLPIAAGTPMGGYVARTGASDGTIDRLDLHAVTFADGRRRFALLVFDLLAVNADVVAAIREAAPAVGVDRVWVSATHTHAGPDVGCPPGGEGVTPTDLLRRLVSESVELLRRATVDERPAAGTVHRVRVHGAGGVRADASRAPVVPVDLLAIRGERGPLEGLVVSIPIHPTVLPASNRRISADLHGAVRAVLSQRLAAAEGPDPWIVAATGAAGDISTRHVRRGRDLTECYRLADIVVEAVLGGLDEPGSVAWDAAGTPGDELRWNARHVRLSPAPAVADLLRVIRASTEERARLDGRSLEVLGEGARAAMRRSDHGDGLDATIESVRLGQMGLVAVPGELFLGLGEALTVTAPGPTVVLGYANGYLGYFPDEAAYDRPSYEVLVSPSGRGGGERIVAAGLAALEELGA